MHPWVARQWHVLRPSVRVHCRLQGLSRPPCAVLRPYSTTAHGNERSSTPISTNSAIIIPTSIADAKPDDIIQHINPVSQERVLLDRFAVFFVTPSFASWLLDDATFLHRALARAYSHTQDVKRYRGKFIVHALCAVVDKLPAAPSLDAPDKIESLAHQLRARTSQPPIGETGFEGIAYATLRTGDCMPTPRASQPAPEQAAVSFVASQSFKHRVGHITDTLRLPLANTVFQTGSTYTMIYSRWQKDIADDDFTLAAKWNPTHHGIKLHTDVLCSRQSSTLAIPLIPLTFPRRVEASMGNILRQVTGEDGKTVVASHELEKVVPQFFSARGDSPQATTVWALVMSREILASVLATTTSMLGQFPDSGDLETPETGEGLWRRLWAQEPPPWNELVPDALAAGVRLHRVLSGGGGWGKKAGLLSLDPTVVAKSEPAGEKTIADGPGDLSSALQPVVCNGDYVQFFTSPPGTLSKSHSTMEALKELQGTKERWNWELGTIPSTANALTSNSWQDHPSVQKEILVFRNSFGALTEGGITIDRQFKLQEKEPSSVLGATKVDVPFTRFSAVKKEDRGDASEALISHFDAKPLVNNRKRTSRKLYEAPIRKIKPKQPETSSAIYKKPSTHVPIRFIVHDSPDTSSATTDSLVQSNNIQSNNIQSNNIQSNNIQSNNIQSDNTLKFPFKLFGNTRSSLAKATNKRDRKIKFTNNYMKSLTRAVKASEFRIVITQKNLERLLNTTLPRMSASREKGQINVRKLSRQASSAIGRIQALRKEALILLSAISDSPISLPGPPPIRRATRGGGGRMVAPKVYPERPNNSLSIRKNQKPGPRSAFEVYVQKFDKYIIKENARIRLLNAEVRKITYTIHNRKPESDKPISRDPRRRRGVFKRSPLTKSPPKFRYIAHPLPLRLRFHVGPSNRTRRRFLTRRLRIFKVDPNPSLASTSPHELKAHLNRRERRLGRRLVRRYVRYVSMVRVRRYVSIDLCGPLPLPLQQDTRYSRATTMKNEVMDLLRGWLHERPGVGDASGQSRESWVGSDEWEKEESEWMEERRRIFGAGRRRFGERF